MEISRRNFLQAFAVGVAGTVLAACAPKTPTQAPAAQATPVPAEKKAEAPKPAGDKIVLTQWYHEYGEKGCLEAVTRIAQEYSDSQDKVTIEVGWFPGDYIPKVNAALAAGDPPDLFEHHLDMDYVRNNYIVALDDVVTADEKADFLDAFVQYGSLKGKLYGVTVVADFQGLYYRKSFLDEVGMGNIDPYDWDWNKVFEAGEKATSGRRKGLFLGNEGGGPCMRDYGVVNAGIWRLNPETLELDFNSDVTVQVFDQFREYAKKNTLLQGAPMDWWDPSSFNQGLCAIQWGGLWQAPGTKAGVADDFFMTIFPPHPAGGDKAKFWSEFGGWCESVTTKSKDVEEATKYLHWQWVENIDWQNEYSTAYGFHIPARKSAREVNKNVTEGYAKTMFEMAEKYATIMPKLWGGAVTTPWNDAVTEIFKNNADIKPTLDKAFEQCQKELEIKKKYWDELPGA